MSKRAKGYDFKIHPHHVSAVDALKGKIKLGTKARPAMSNRTIATLLHLDMKTVKKIETNEAYRETVLGRKQPLAPPKEFLDSPILSELSDLRKRVKALEAPAPTEPEEEGQKHGIEGEGEIAGGGDEPPADELGGASDPSGEPGEGEPETAKGIFPLGK